MTLSAPMPAQAELTTPHALQACWDLQLAGLNADALRLALECGVFDHLQDFTEPHLLAAGLTLDASNTGYLLQLLWGMGLLERAENPPRYRNSPLAERYLSREAPEYCGDALLFRHSVLRQAGQQLGNLLRNGCSPAPAASTAVRQNWANAARVQIAQEQRAVTVELARRLLENLPEYPRLERVLDLGGGPGLIAINLAQRLPTLQAALFEYPEAAAVAAENIARAGLGERVQALSGDLEQDDFGNDYDLIWCSSVLHFVSDLPALLQRLHSALRPGGVLVCCHAEVSSSAQGSARILPYYLHMRMHGRHVLDQGALARMLENSGFVDVQQLDGLAFPVAPVSAVIARKTQR